MLDTLTEGFVEEEITIQALEKVSVKVTGRPGYISVVVSNDNGLPVAGLVTLLVTPDGRVREVAVIVRDTVVR